MDVHIVAPVAGTDYPRTWSEFQQGFGSEEACAAYLERRRWPQGFRCPRCAVQAAPYRSSRGRLMCRHCAHQSTVTAGTIFDKTRTALSIWLAAAWYLTNQKHGISALGLQRVLGLGSYQTAWTLLHRFRRAMVRPDREPLQGVVEVDASYLAITARKRAKPRARGKRCTNKLAVMLAVEMLQPKGFGRIRLQRIDSESTTEALAFVQARIALGSTVRTDGSAVYRDLPALGYTHTPTVQLGSAVAAHVSMAGVHRVAALLKRWLLGTHHGSVQPEHLDAYLDEFVFRFNRRSSRSRGLLFYRLLQQAMLTDPLTYETIVASRQTVP